MRLVVLVSTLAVFLSIIALLGGVGKKIDRMDHRYAQLKETERVYNDEELKKSFSERVFRPAVQRVSEQIRRSADKNKPVKLSRANQKVERQLKASGLKLTLQEYRVIKNLLILLFLIGGILLYVLLQIDVMYRLLIVIVLANIPVLGSSFFLNARVRARKESIMIDLPEVMDILVVSVEAGLGLDSAIVQQYSKNKSAVLMELNSAIREIQMGVPRKVALKEMADRCDVKELTAFVTALLQAEQLGVSIKSVLMQQSERLRVERKQMIQAKAAKAPIKIMIPTVIFIFPVVFIILLGPAVVSLIQTFG
ncbi:MAG: type II secretion system F family protein [Christensenella sp.]|nr:type II secretion system F family protein [Christensenella sp.]